MRKPSAADQHGLSADEILKQTETRFLSASIRGDFFVSLPSDACHCQHRRRDGIAFSSLTGIAGGLPQDQLSMS
jgi:hypothetical protein